MNPDKKRFWLVVRLIAYAVSLLLGVAVALPSFVKSRWASSGVPVAYKFSVVDAQTGKPIPGAKALVWISADETWPINGGSAGHISATPAASGTCEVHSHFPGTGSGGKVRLSVNSTIWIRADGYEPWQKPTAALLGSHLTVSHPFSRTNSCPVKVKMSRKETANNVSAAGGAVPGTNLSLGRAHLPILVFTRKMKARDRGKAEKLRRRNFSPFFLSRFGGFPFSSK